MSYLKQIVIQGLLHLILGLLPLIALARDGHVIHVRAVGDIMLGTQTPTGFLRPQTKGSILKYIQPYLQAADLTLGNLEGTLCNSGATDKCEPDSLDCYLFRMPERYGADLNRAGFDWLSLANNHIGDFGADCRARTEQILDSLGIGWSGRPGTYSIRKVAGVSVVFVAFHSGGFCNSLLDIPAAAAWIKQLKAENDLVVVSMHGGAEGLSAMTLPDTMEWYYGEPRGNLRQFAHAVIEAGADLVVGHGPHVPRAVELYQGRIIAYSLGNFATYGRFNLQDERRFGAILDVTFSRSGKLLSAKLISIEQRYWGVPFIDPEHRFAWLVDSLSSADTPEYGAHFSTVGNLIYKD